MREKYNPLANFLLNFGDTYRSLSCLYSPKKGSVFIKSLAVKPQDVIRYRSAS